MTSEDIKHQLIITVILESRRDQEEGGELESQEDASPEEINSREVVLGLESWTSSASVVSQRRSYGHRHCNSVLHSS